MNNFKRFVEQFNSKTWLRVDDFVLTNNFSRKNKWHAVKIYKIIDSQGNELDKVSWRLLIKKGHLYNKNESYYIQFYGDMNQYTFCEENFRRFDE